MVTFKPIKYKYSTNINWLKEHEGKLTAAHKHAVQVGCPPEFGGKPEYWSPEELFVASAELCIMTTFIDLCKRHHCKILSYKSKAEGLLHIFEGEFRFSKIKIWPVIIAASSEDLEKAAQFIKKAEEECVVSRSVKTDVCIEPKLQLEKNN
jgi:organic hydroperoxide reductase OsmC/OhrA